MVMMEKSRNVPMKIRYLFIKSNIFFVKVQKTMAMAMAMAMSISMAIVS